MNTLYIHVVKIPGAEEDPAFLVAVGVDGMLKWAVISVERALTGEPPLCGAQARCLLLLPSVKVAPIVLHRFQLICH